jgi:hypothetical protein
MPLEDARCALKWSIYVSNEIRFLLEERNALCIYYASASSEGVSLTKKFALSR